MVLGVYPYLRTNGNGKDVVEFYKDVFDAELLGVQTYGDFPENPEFPISDEIKRLVAHAQLKIGNTFLMLSDNFPDDPYEVGTNLNIAVLISDVEKTKKYLKNFKSVGKYFYHYRKHHLVRHMVKSKINIVLLGRYRRLLNK